MLQVPLQRDELSVKHFHVYDTCGEVMCVDAACFSIETASTLMFLKLWEFETLDEYPLGTTDPDPVAVFNWSNVVCVREEEDDDEDSETAQEPIPAAFLVN